MSYTYSINTHFSGIIPDFTALYDLVVNSSITQPLQNIIRDDDDLFTFHFSNTLTAGEIITLNNICTPTSIPYTVDFYTTYNSTVVSTDLIPQGPTDLQALSATGPTGQTGPTGSVGLTGPTGEYISYLGESSATGTYSWSLTANVNYELGVTSPTNNLITILSPNSYWQLNSDRLQYIGTSTISVNFMVSINYNASTTSRTYNFDMLKNSVVIPNTRIRSITSTSPIMITYTKVVDVSTNDILSLRVSSTSGNTMTLNYLTLSVF